VGPTAAEIEEVRRRLREDTPFYSQHCLSIVDKRARLGNMIARPAQLRLDAAMEAQREAGRPIRIIVLKSRKVGISTWVQGKILQRITQNPNRRGLVVAQDNDTASELFDIAWTMYVNLPEDPDVKPALIARRNSPGGLKMMQFGNPASSERVRGEIGLNSTLQIDTAREVAAGRGKTITDLHASEAGWWPDPRKALSLFNAVPDEPETMIVVESTANGSNFFKARWDRAIRGEGTFAPVFIGWTEDEDCQKAFASEESREAFLEQIGAGPWGDDEPRLVERFGATAEQLLWRRETIVDKCDGRLDLFKQEFPSSPEEAFIGSTRHVFSMAFVQRALDRATEIAGDLNREGGPQEGVLIPTQTTTRRLSYGEMDVPVGALFTPRRATGFGASHPYWTIYEPPYAGHPGAIKDPPGQYIVAVDPRGDEVTESGESSWAAIQVIDHRTGWQVAEFRCREDPEQVSQQALLAGLFYNEAWIVVETTGGYGLPVVRTLWKTFGYRRVYTRMTLDSRKEKTQDRLGWSTDRRTKPLMESGMHELLRQGVDGVRSRLLALEMTTYVRDDRGNHGPDEDAFDDLLMAYLIAHEVKREKPIRPVYKPGDAHSSLTRRFLG